MNNPSSTQNGGGEDVPSWMKTVNEETFYNAHPSDDTDDEPSRGSAPSPSPDVAPPSPDSSQDPTVPEDNEKPLRKKLSLSMGAPSELPQPDPDLQPEIVGHVRADLNRQLESAVSVLNTRYAENITKSLVLEFALRQTLLNLQEQDENSSLVQWLDSVLPQS